MAEKAKYKLKQVKGVLHIGGGRFFYPDESYELTSKELKAYGQHFEKIEEKDLGQGEGSVITNDNNT